MSDWKTAGSAGDSWKPENEGDTLTGIYTGSKSEVGINKSEVYSIQVAGEEEPTSVWGSTVLDTKFQEIPVGNEVRIEYLGLEKGKGPKPYKNFNVQYREVDDTEAIKKGAEEAFPDKA